MKKISTVSLLTMSHFSMWLSLLLSHLIAPEVLQSNGPFSIYATLPDTFLIYAFGIAITGSLTIIISRRITAEYAQLKWSLFLAGIASILLIFFRIDIGNFSFQVHRILTAILFLGLTYGILYTSLIKIRSTTNLFLSFLILFGATLLLLSTDFFKVFEILPQAETIILLSITAWTQINFRREESLLKESSLSTTD